MAIADLAGGDWPSEARRALIKICAQEEDASKGVKLLAAFRTIFDSTGKDKLTTKEILEALVAIEDGPWALMFEDALKHDRFQTAASRLARMLKEYKIKPRTIKITDQTTAKGYQRADFEKAWERYLPPSGEAVTAVTAVTHEQKKVTAPVKTSVTPFFPRETLNGYEVTAVTAPQIQKQKPAGSFKDDPLIEEAIKLFGEARGWEGGRHGYKDTVDDEGFGP